jgi:hypothetical protein
MNIGAMNRVAIYEQLQKLSKQYLSDIDETSIALFVSEAKKVVDRSFDNYVLSQEEFYTKDPVRSIKDKANLLAFTDIRSGYRRQMQDWVEANPIEVKTLKISLDDMPAGISVKDREALRRSLSTFGVGTILVVGLKMLTGMNWLYWAELAVLGLASQQYKVGRDADTQRMQEIRKEHLVRKIAHCIRHDLDGWLDKAEQENKKVLESFNL